jgi:hypothetical protein
MDESARERLAALARQDSERAAGLTVRALVHEVRNALNPLGLQIAILRQRLPPQDDDVDQVLDGLRETLAGVYATLDGAARLGHKLAPGTDPSPVADKTEDTE